MKQYTFTADEFARLVYVQSLVQRFMHADRSKQELDAFTAENYPLWHDVHYNIVLAKISETQTDAISRNDPWPPDGPKPETAIAQLAAILGNDR